MKTQVTTPNDLAIRVERVLDHLRTLEFEGARQTDEADADDALQLDRGRDTADTLRRLGEDLASSGCNGPPRQARFTEMVVSDLLAFVRANLPPPPSHLLEIGAGDGMLSRALAEAGYDVLAIDPESGGADVRPVPLHELAEPAGSFAAALAVTSLHHVEPLEQSIGRLAELLEPGGALVVDEFDVAAFDERAAEWWLRQRRALGAAEHASADELVGEHRAHLHPLARIVAALEPHFHVGTPLYGPYLYRWDLDESFRPHEENAIAQGEIPAVGARLVAHRSG